MKWISVNKKVPTKNKKILVYAPNNDIIGHILIGTYYPKNKTFPASWTVYDFGGSELDGLVTHWMELPKAP